MKILFLPLAALALLCLSFSKEKPFAPPGTVRISDSLYADATEISNFDWQEYEFWTKTFYGSRSKEHLATLPDTLVWREKLSYNEPYVQYYYRHPAYRDFPVVGVSYEQAVAYCQWRTERVKTILAVRNDYKHQELRYRLPTRAEWEKLADGSMGLLSGEGKDAKGAYGFNFLHPNTPKSDTSSSLPYPDVTVDVNTYRPKSLMLYNVLGNVAEMVQEKGICKGGSWLQRLEECRPGKDIGYTAPASWIGFRCVCIVAPSSR